MQTFFWRHYDQRMVLLYVECAFAAGAGAIITNDRHVYHPLLESFGLTVCNAGACVADLAERR
jgi:hypothetical protein